jgi:hypothetical protein
VSSSLAGRANPISLAAGARPPRPYRSVCGSVVDPGRPAQSVREVAACHRRRVRRDDLACPAGARPDGRGCASRCRTGLLGFGPMPVAGRVSQSMTGPHVWPAAAAGRAGCRRTSGRLPAHVWPAAGARLAGCLFACHVSTIGGPRPGHGAYHTTSPATFPRSVNRDRPFGLVGRPGSSDRQRLRGAPRGHRAGTAFARASSQWSAFAHASSMWSTAAHALPLWRADAGSCAWSLGRSLIVERRGDPSA